MATRKKTTKKTTKKTIKKTEPKKVKRVAPDNGTSAADVAATLGMTGLAKELTVEKPKPFLADLEKEGSVTKVRHPKNQKTIDEILEGFDEDFTTKLVEDASTENLQYLEEEVVRLTNEYWQARRSLLLANTKLNQIYKNIEDSGSVSGGVKIAGKEIKSALAKAFEKELFK